MTWSRHFKGGEEEEKKVLWNVLPETELTKAIEEPQQ